MDTLGLEMDVRWAEYDRSVWVTDGDPAADPVERVTRGVVDDGTHRWAALVFVPLAPTRGEMVAAARPVLDAAFAAGTFYNFGPSLKASGSPSEVTSG